MDEDDVVLAVVPIFCPWCGKEGEDYSDEDTAHDIIVVLCKDCAVFTDIKAPRKTWGATPSYTRNAHTCVGGESE